MKIALDAVGGDFAPQAVIEGAKLALAEQPENLEIVLIGPQEVVEPLLEKEEGKTDRMHLVHAPDVIGMAEHPMKAFAQKKESSIAKGYALLKTKAVDAFCSAGNTGAMLVGAIYSIKLEEVNRPAIMSHVPKLTGGHSIMLDVGANTDCKAETLAQFAEIGAVFYSQLQGEENPRVALINLGEEAEKGNLVTQAAYKLIKEKQQINFVGNIEGRDLFKDKADVLVCDGFVGNVIIKMAESYYEILQRKSFSDPFFDNFNYELVGGSPILGVEGNVIIGHGVSNGKAVKSMVSMAQRMIEADLHTRIKKALLA